MALLWGNRDVSWFLEAVGCSEILWDALRGCGMLKNGIFQSGYGVI